jgi:1,4-dihydroxy-2-naphthoate octaprenyltransferase
MQRWILGARPRTLPAAVAPVLVGTSTAVGVADGIIWWRALAALVVSLALQVGVNFANDLSDGLRGTDGLDRIGPRRLVGSGLATAGEVRWATFAAFSVAAVVGLVLSLAVAPWLLLVGVAAIAAGWLYTGGPNPYGYLGLGEVFVFVFFGLVATVGSSYVQAGRITGLAVVAGSAVGLLACALLAVNNLRDITGDTAAGKRTLAARIGDRRARWLYVAFLDGGLVLGSLCALSRPWCLLVLGGALPAGAAVRAVLGGAAGPRLVGVLALTGRTQLLAGSLLSLGLVLSG